MVSFLTVGSSEYLLPPTGGSENLRRGGSLDGRTTGKICFSFNAIRVLMACSQCWLASSDILHWYWPVSSARSHALFGRLRGLEEQFGKQQWLRKSILNAKLLPPTALAGAGTEGAFSLQDCLNSAHAVLDVVPSRK
jgi:hypothetical protein